MALTVHPNNSKVALICGIYLFIVTLYFKCPDFDYSGLIN